MTRSTRILVLASLAVSTALTLTTAGTFATPIVSDGFSGTSGTDINGRTPDGANLPGGTWSVYQQNAGGTSPMTLTTVSQTNAVSTNFNDSAGISITSANGYTEPSVLNISGEVYVNNSTAVGIGFLSGFPAAGSGTDSGTTFSGVQWNGGLKDLFLQQGTNNTYLGNFNALSLDAFYTLSYTIDTSTGNISNLTFDGSSVATPTASFFTPANTALAGFYATSGAVTDTAYVANFSVSGAVPEPGALAILGASATALLIWKRRVAV